MNWRTIAGAVSFGQTCRLVIGGAACCPPPAGVCAKARTPTSKTIPSTIPHDRRFMCTSVHDRPRFHRGQESRGLYPRNRQRTTSGFEPCRDVMVLAAIESGGQYNPRGGYGCLRIERSVQMAGLAALRLRMVAAAGLA